MSDQLLETDEQTPVDRPAVVDGAVTLQDTPVEGAEVMVFYDSDTAEATTQTDENGEYAFTTIDEQEVTKVVVNVTGATVSGYENNFYATSQKQVDANSTPITKDFNFIDEFDDTVNQSQVLVSHRVESNQINIGYVGNIYTLQALNHKTELQEKNNELELQTEEYRYDQYKQTNNIDGSATENWNSGAGFKPIGSPSTDYDNYSSTKQFTASYNGNGYEISNLYINRPDAISVGLFGDLFTKPNEQKINNIYVTDSKIVGGNYAGAITGISSEGVYKNLSVSNTSVKAENYIGAVIGSNNGELTSSYATDNSVEASAEFSDAGGFVGVNDGRINESFSTTTTVTGSESGGFIGVNNGIVTNAYVLDSEISGTGSRDIVGGFVGHNIGHISKVYAVATINSPDLSGGVAGRLYGGSISDAYYTTSSVSDGIGQINSENDTDAPSQTNVTSVTRSELTENPESTMSALDYDTVWVSNGSIPTLQTFIVEEQETQTDAEE